MKYLGFFCLLWLLACQTPSKYDLVIKNGIIYDGSGNQPITGDIGINQDTIATIAEGGKLQGKIEIDAQGKAIAPGFINMLSWADLLKDGRSVSDLKQGVTLEIFGEGWSEAPLNEKMKVEVQKNYQNLKDFKIWTSLGEYLEMLEKRGISTNVASFVGATTLRIHEIGYENRKPSPQELEKMKKLVQQAMEEGAMGLGSSLIYAPAFYAQTEELIELAKVAGQYGGIYISHIRSEGNRLLESADELIRIAREAKIPAEFYHLKVGGKANWHKVNDLIAKIEKARAEGLKITADMYTYIAGATGLDASMPPWAQEGGHDKWVERLKNPTTRQKIKQEINALTDKWENLYLAAGSPDKVLLSEFKNDSLKYLTGKTLAEVAKMRKADPVEVMMDLVIQDNSRIECVYFLMDEENVKKQLKLPFVSLGSDAQSLIAEGENLKFSTHPRAYGNFARFLGKYVREEKIMTLPEAIRRLTSLPAENLKIKKRGALKVGYFADIVVFDADKIIDKATFDKPHQYAEGVIHVWVNGKQVIKNGEHTGIKSGRVVRGAGWKGWKK